MHPKISIQTEFSDKIEDLENSLSKIPSFSFKEGRISKESLYATKLESLIKQYKESIKNNKIMIQQLENQRKFYRKVCEKQKDKIQNTNIDLFKEEYENEIKQQRMKKQRLYEMIEDFHDEAEQDKRQFLESYEQLEKAKDFMKNSYIELDKQNRQFNEIIENKEQKNMINQQRIKQNQLILDSKIKLESQYKRILLQIESKENLNN